MIRLSALSLSLSLCIAVADAVVGAAPARAQAPATPPATASPAIPSMPAGTVLRAWLDAFNSGDTTRIAAYGRTFQPDLELDQELRFRQQTSGFNLVSIEKSEPRHIEFIVRERKSPMTGYGVIDVSDGKSPRVTTRTVQALGPNVSAAALRIDAPERTRVINGAAARLDSFYVFPDVAKRMGDSIHARLARGDYDRYDNGMTFARRLNDDLSEIAHDKHLNLRYSARGFPPAQSAGTAPSPEDLAQERKQMDEVNCGFRKVEQLDGNVGYLKFDMFADADICGATASAAMNFLAGSRALIIDLRENGGGSPGMVALVASYLFDTRTHLNDLWTRRNDSTQQFFTRDSVSGRRFGGTKPVYLLTSSHTFSGAEEFAYDLKSLGRATIVGETTGGGAHPVRGRRIDEHFMIGVPFARAINPTTHTNWEGVGVTPDVTVATGGALETAKKLIAEKLRP